MPLFAPLDLFALAFFSVTWIVYAVLLEWTPKGARGLNARMHGYRDEWMQQMLRRDMRMLDGQIMGSLQNGTAFFASTSLIAIGGTLTVLRSTEDLITIVSTLPFGIPTTRMEWEIKTIGLATIFVYAFFKFAWSYRLYNYVAIMIGAMPPATREGFAGSQAACAAHRQALRIRRTAFQPRPARLLLRARLSRLVHLAVAVVPVQHRDLRRDVGAAILVGFARRRGRGIEHDPKSDGRSTAWRQIGSYSSNQSSARRTQAQDTSTTERPVAMLSNSSSLRSRR